MGLVNSALSAVFEIYMADMFFSYFGKRRLKKNLHFIVCIIFTVILSITTYLFIPTNHSIYSYSSIIILFSFLFKTKPIMQIFAVVVELFIIMFGETAITLLLLVFTDLNIELMRDHSQYHWLIAMILSKLIAFGLFKVIGLRKLNTEGLSAGFILGLFTMPLSSIFIVFMMFGTSAYFKNDVYLILVITSGILLTLANIFVFFIIEKQSEYIKTKQQLEFAETHIENQKAHYKELYNQQENLKKFRHDSKNMYTALLSKIETMSPKDAADYVREQLSIVFDTSNEINSGNAVIDAVIRSKKETAKNNDIIIETSFKLSNDIHINELDMGVLIGNALDNAIEACELLADKSERLITISIITVKEMLSIKVENKCTPPPLAIFGKQGETKKEDKKNHGYGIHSMKTIAEKYDGIVTPEYKDGVFTLSIIMTNIKQDI